MELISVVVPCFNEEESIPIFYDEILKTALEFGKRFSEVGFEFVFVDDGSKDRTLPILKELHEKDERVRYISFSKNFGKESALYAGLQNAKGDYVVCMDVDLQDPPALLPEMFAAVYEEGYDSAATRRVTRKGEPPIRSFFARKFYVLMNKMSKTEVVDGARDYRVMTRQMVDAILSMKEYNRFTKGIYGWIGFNTKWFEFENVERVAGETKWSFIKLLFYAVDGIFAFSTVPLNMWMWIGGAFTFAAFVFLVAAIVLCCQGLYGMGLLIAALVAFFGSLLLLEGGLLAQYLARAYLEVKERPIYIVRESTDMPVKSATPKLVEETAAAKNPEEV